MRDSYVIPLAFLAGRDCLAYPRASPVVATSRQDRRYPTRFGAESLADGNSIISELVPDWFWPLIDLGHRSDAHPVWDALRVSP